MLYLLDTNILLRLSQPGALLAAVAEAAVNALIDQGQALFIVPQNVIEFWSVATRPPVVNGLGLTPADVDLRITDLETIFPVLPETPDLYPAWRALVRATGVTGVRVHDARLVAAMQVHGLTHLLTFDAQDFRPFTGITVVSPQDVAGAAP